MSKHAWGVLLSIGGAMLTLVLAYPLNTLRYLGVGVGVIAVM